MSTLVHVLCLLSCGLSAVLVSRRMHGPILKPQLFVVPAGRSALESRHAEVALRDGSRVCRSHYPEGLSIRCDPAASVRWVKFYVNGVYARTEVTEPHYIAGTYSNGAVKAWRTHRRVVNVVCKFGRNTHVAARIKFRC